jgi:23S rRNA (uracil1939-C5)-methyltransferase
MSYDAQLAAKQLIIRDSLQRIGKRSVEPPPIERSPDEWRYRTKLTLAMRHRGARWIAGLHPYDDPAGVFALADCPITDRRVVATWREVMNADAYFPDSRELRGSVRITRDGPTFVMSGGRSWAARDQFSAAVPSVSALWWEPDGEAGTERRKLYDRRSDRSPSASFVQVNAGVAAALRDYVVSLTVAHAPRTVVDAYAGAGHTAIALAKTGIAVTAIELDTEASDWSATQLEPPSRAVAARVEDALPAYLPADLVLLNPPRAGLDARVTEILEAEPTRAKRLIYISCNPATLARDLSRLPGFRIQSLRAFDMFPQTAHVETVCELSATGIQ